MSGSSPEFDDLMGQGHAADRARAAGVQEKGYLYVGIGKTTVGMSTCSDPLTFAEAKAYAAGFMDAKNRFADDFALKQVQQFYWKPDVGGPLVIV